MKKTLGTLLAIVPVLVGFVLALGSAVLAVLGKVLECLGDGCFRSAELLCGEKLGR